MSFFDYYLGAFVQLALLWGMPLAMGAAIPRFVTWVRDLSPFFWCYIVQVRSGTYYLVKKVRKRLGAEDFNVGERHFLIDSASVSMYNDNHPVLFYNLDKARARKARIGPDKIELHPPTEGKDPSSRSSNLFYRRRGITQMINATKNISMQQIVPFMVFAGFFGLMLGFAVFNYWHPGLYPAPPVGYEYKAVPIPTNATAVTK